MEKKFFQWKEFSEEHGGLRFPMEVLEEVFLLDFEDNSVWLSKPLARILYFEKEELMNRISVEEMEQFFMEGGRDMFRQEIQRLCAGKMNHGACHVAVERKDTALSAVCYLFALESSRYLFGFLSVDYDPIHEYEQQLENMIRQMRHTHDINQLILEGSVDYIFQIDVVNNICTISSKALEIFPLDTTTFSDASGKLLALVVPEDRQAYLDAITEFLSGETDEYRVKYRMRARNGEIVWLLNQGKGLRDEKGNPVMLAGSIVDITEQQEREERIHQILYRDSLTGLKNNRCFEVDLKSRMENKDARGSLIYLNIRKFKLFNELFGRQFANGVLEEVGRMLQLYFPKAIDIYRFAGDDFLIHLPEYDKKGIMARLLPFFNGLKNTREIGGHTFYLNMYAAVILYPECGETVEELMMHANQCLHKVSCEESVKIGFYDGQMGEDVTRRYLLENELRRDIQNNFQHFRMVYQPIVRVGKNGVRWLGAEALLRYSNPKLPDVGQMEMIHVLEYSGLIMTVGRWVVSQAVRECAKWNQAGADTMVHVNMAAQQVTDAGLVSYIKEQCEHVGLAPEKLIVELTETSLVNNFSMATQLCSELREFGVGVALDDFGTGYSGFSYLRNFPISKIKIDREYAKDIPNNHYNQVIINFMRNLSEDISVELCVEGVETKEELELLTEMGVSVIQGFYFERPMEANSIRREFYKQAAAEKE